MPRAIFFAIFDVFVLDLMHFSARKVMCARPRPRVISATCRFGPDCCICIFTIHLLRLKFRLPQNAFALLGKSLCSSDAPQANFFAIFDVFVLDLMHFSALKVMCPRARPRVISGTCRFGPDSGICIFTIHLVRLKFRPPQNVFALLGKN